MTVMLGNKATPMSSSSRARFQLVLRQCPTISDSKVQVPRPTLPRNGRLAHANCRCGYKTASSPGTVAPCPCQPSVARLPQARCHHDTHSACGVKRDISTSICFAYSSSHCHRHGDAGTGPLHKITISLAATPYQHYSQRMQGCHGAPCYRRFQGGAPSTPVSANLFSI